MENPIFCIAGDTSALRHAANKLTQWGYEITATPSRQATHLLLPVPSFDTDGTIKGGPRISEILSQLQPKVTALGGNLPVLPCPSIDFLQDEYYLQENASITARCALSRLVQTQGTLQGTQTLVIGWGRIGKHLAVLLQKAGAEVSVAARKKTDLALIAASGYLPVNIRNWNTRHFHVIINTAPAPLLDQNDTQENALLMDLASERGITGDRVIWARGLPNRDAPEESGMLIAKTALRYALGKELL